MNDTDAANDTAPSTEAAPTEAAETEASPAPEQKLAAALAEAAQLKDQLLRALAEAENTRRRTQRDRDEASKFAVTAFARDLLAVADNLRRALDAIPAAALEDDPALRNLAAGVEMTERQLVSVFESHNVRRFEAVGERFDGNLHQAMMQVPGEGQAAGTIVQVMQPGYLLHDRLLRPALVAVASGEGSGAKPGDEKLPGGHIDTVA